MARLHGTVSKAGTRSAQCFGLALLVSVVAAFAATSANATSLYDQGFETDTSGWSSGDPYGSITRVASGTGGISAYQGNYFAYVNDATPNGPNAGDSSGPYTFFGGARSTFPGTYTASIAIYLNTNWTAGSGFDYSVAAGTSSGNFLRDFIFNVSNSSGNLLVGASNNSSDTLPSGTLTDVPNYKVTTSGWYIFQQTFYDDNGVLAVNMDLYNAAMTLLFSQTLSDPSDTFPGVGGNQYGWFPVIDVSDPDGLAIDAVSLSTTPLPATLPLFLSGIGFLAFLANRRRARNHPKVVAA